ncbi:hypothetical protein BD779DRAFT_1059395 [Infundibulicybe gibba]|nr:hypothetical protein BD779DRAFT_1059395 [Infundibulicybe gibba]
MCSFLPQEITDLIICALQDDLVAVKCCSLVHSTWLHASRMAFVREVTLDLSSLPDQPIPSNRKTDPDSPILRRFQLLAKIFDETPRLTQSVRCLTIYGFLACERDLDSLLASIISRLTNVENFRLDNIQWPGDVSRLTRSVFDILTNPSIISIEINGMRAHHVSQLVELSVRSPNLKKLSFAYIQCTRSWDVGDAVFDRLQCYTKVGPQSVSLRHLDIRGAARIYRHYDWLLHPQCPISVGELRHLFFDDKSWRDDTSIVRGFLEKAGQGLQYLTLRSTFRHGPAPLHISLTPHLRHLTLFIPRCLPTIGVSPLQMLFDGFKPEHPLETVVINILKRTIKDTLLQSGWSTLDRILNALPGLRRVCFEFRGEVMACDELENFRAHFPLLLTSEKLDVHNQV